MKTEQKSHRVIAWEKLIAALNLTPVGEITNEGCRRTAIELNLIGHEKQGPKFAALRKLAKLTQTELAEKSGVSINTIQRIETDAKHEHFLSNLNKICAVYGLTYAEFTIL